MKVWLVRFTAKQLRNIHQDHLGFILASSHCCNELTATAPYIIFEHDHGKATEAEQIFIQMRQFTLMRFHVAKIFEYRELCSTYIGRIRTTFPAMASEAAKYAKPITRKIGEATWAKTLRDKISSHFDEAYIAAALISLPDDEKLSFLIGEKRGITAFNFADRAVVGAMFREAGNGDEQHGVTVMSDWTIDLSRTINQFHSTIVKKIFAQYGLFSQQDEGEIRDERCATRGEFFIPLVHR